MGMPQGHKVDHGYSTVSDLGGLGYREIAEKMTEMGDKMNHSTARNIFISAMKKIAQETCRSIDANLDQGNITRVANDPRFQSGVIDILRDAVV
jgi:hypothetical protein